MTPLEEFLSATPFFGGLEPAQLARLSKRLKVREVMAGEAVFREHEQGRSMYVVERGELCAWQAAEISSLARVTSGCVNCPAPLMPCAGIAPPWLDTKSIKPKLMDCTRGCAAISSFARSTSGCVNCP